MNDPQDKNRFQSGDLITLMSADVFHICDFNDDVFAIKRHEPVLIVKVINKDRVDVYKCLYDGKLCWRACGIIDFWFRKA